MFNIGIEIVDTGVKVLFVAFSVLYLVFAFLIFKQVNQLMSIIKTKLTHWLKWGAFVHLLLSISVLVIGVAALYYG